MSIYEYKKNKTEDNNFLNNTTIINVSKYDVLVKKIDKVTITIYPMPNATAASNYLNVYYVKRIQDAGAYTNSSDAPYRFIPCMVSGLTFYLSQKYAPQLTQQMKLLYEDELARALQEDGSSASAYITPKTYYPNI